MNTQNRTWIIIFQDHLVCDLLICDWIKSHNYRELMISENNNNYSHKLNISCEIMIISFCDFSVLHLEFIKLWNCITHFYSVKWFEETDVEINILSWSRIIIMMCITIHALATAGDTHETSRSSVVMYF